MPLIHEGAATGLSLMIPLVKIDVERRLVIGRAAQEMPDKTREIMDYATARPAFESWSADRYKESGGLSKGNVRVMHSRVAAGRLDAISFDDVEKSVEVVAHIVDDNEWEKCLKGVYTGFSIGGGYEKKWKDGDYTRYTPRITELSLVDSPCIPSARFAELVKADGVVEQMELHGRRPRSFADLVAEKAPAAPSPLTFGQMRKRQPPVKAALTFSDLRKRRPAAVSVATEMPRRPFVQGATVASG